MIVAGGARRAELLALLARHSVRFGEFTLSSGKRSDLYIDARLVTLDGRGARLIGQMVLDRSRALGATAVGGLTLGADPIAAAAAALSGDDVAPLRAFIVRKQVKEHGTGRPIEGPPLTSQDRVVLVEDVITTAGSVLTAARRVRETGATILEVVVVVDREEGGRAALEAEGISLHALFQRSDFVARSPRESG